MEKIYKPVIEFFDAKTFSDSAINGMYKLFGFAIADYLAIKHVDIASCKYDDVKEALGDNMLYAAILEEDSDPDDIIKDIETHPAVIYIFDYYDLSTKGNSVLLRSIVDDITNYLDHSKYYDMNSYENRIAYCENRITYCVK